MTRTANRRLPLMSLLFGLAIASVSRAQEAPVAQESPAPEMATTQSLRIVRNVVVAQFAAPEGSQARSSVLRTLADHGDVEVVSMDDVAFASMRLQADPGTAAGRAKLSRELGIDTWLDGRIEGSTAHLTLTSGDGTLIQEVTVEANDSQRLDELTGSRMWAAMGTRLSPQEEQRRALLAQYELAREKFEARTAQLERITEVAHQARAQRAAILRAQFALAQRKRAAFQAELTRQAQLALSRPPEAETAVASKSTATRSKSKSKSKSARASKRSRKKHKAATASLTNTSGMKSKKKHGRKGNGSEAAAVGGTAGSEPELLSRQ